MLMTEFFACMNKKIPYEATEGATRGTFHQSSLKPAKEKKSYCFVTNSRRTDTDTSF